MSGDVDDLQRRRRSTPDIQRVPSALATATSWTWRLLVLITGAAALLWVAVRLYVVSLPLIIAVILATLCVPPARWLERHGVHRMLAATIVVVGGLLAISGVIAALTPSFITEIRELGPTVTEAFETLLAFLERNFGWDRGDLMEMVDGFIATLTEQSGQLASQVMSGAAVAIQAISALTLALVILFFFVKDGEQIVDWLQARIPGDHAETVRATGRRAWVALGGFVRGTAAVALIDAVGIGIGLAIVRVPLVIPLAVLVFFGAFIPVIGAFVTGFLAVLVALATGGWQQALIILAIIVGVQQFESTVLQPVIMRRAVSLHPVVILGALAAGASLIGIVGAFLAVPVTAVAAAVGNELRLRYEHARAEERAAWGSGPDPGPPGQPSDAPGAPPLGDAPASPPPG